MFFTQYKALFERHTDAVIVVNAQGFIVEANAAFMALTHWTYADFAAQRYDTFFQLEEHQQIAAYDQRAHIICKDGHAVPVLVQKITADAHAFIIAKDMRALDKIAENYLQSELRYRTIAEHIQDVLILMDADKNYLYVSPSAQSMFEFDYRNLQNRSAFFNIHEDDVPMLEQKFEEAVTDGRSFTVKVKAWHEEKQWIWTEMKGKPMYEQGVFQHMLLVARDISIQHTYEERLLYEAYYDVLTNLPNRRKLNEWLDIYQEGLQQQRYFAVMLMDIDHFKHINDYYGHEIGDHVLIEYSHRIAAIVEHHGVVGRYGGDEFMALIPYETPEQLERIAKRLVEVVKQPIDIQQTALSITTSVGVARIETQMAIRTMVKCADDALYKVKERGRNGYVVAIGG